ncbi:MAG: SPOR domain-containing protein [Prevotellaceae bacterium]|jgi:hypothetical protein|nr:SPOR domain-containing protein [Prevotellaceae bacterium]
MKKVLIIFLGVLTVAASGCRNNKKDAQSVEAIRAQQDSIRRVDEQRILELQLKAREDSIAMALANSFESNTSQPTAYYVVVGSFLMKNNANAYLRTMRATFGDAQIIRHGRWNLVCVGGQFSSYASAASTLRSVVSQLGGGGGANEEEDEEEEEEEEEEDTDEEATSTVSGEDGEEEDEEEEEEESEDGFDAGSGGSYGEVGQAWVVGI